MKQSTVNHPAHKSCVGDRGKHLGIPKLLYSQSEAAYALSISKRSVAYFIAQRKLETRRIGKRVLIPAASLQQFAAQNHFGTVAA